MAVRISQNTLDFFADLRDNNTREWFHAHRTEYARLVKEPMRELVGAVNHVLRAVAPEYAGGDDHAMSRPNRDVRFSADKSPYRTDISAVFPCRGRPKEEAAGFFIRLDGSGVEVLGGAYMPAAAPLAAIRRAIAHDGGSLEALVTAPSLVALMGALQGECLQRVPSGFDSHHPAAALLRHKQFYFAQRLPRRVALGSGLESAIAERLRALTPFVRWMDRAMHPSVGRR